MLKQCANQKIIAVDFDGTLCLNAYPSIGKPIPQTIQYIKQQRDSGNTIILWTCRNNELLDSALSWCERQGIVFDYINENAPHNIALYGSDTRKVYADVYVDDNALTLADIAALVGSGGGRP